MSNYPPGVSGDEFQITGNLPHCPDVSAKQLRELERDAREKDEWEHRHLAPLPKVPKCRSCARDAVCYGAYEGDVMQPSCDECCGHGQEDGECVAVGVAHALEGCGA